MSILNAILLIMLLGGCDELDPYKDLNIPPCPWEYDGTQQYIPCDPQ
ncbi:hypothetical protein VB712_04815 [Spirulina sp. CCNP1310]|nr:hypothetical protein [Spirulina sp. CCNP1310]MEA5418538.1 hypothetical protein [Spirulina sp. CCNP1310]